MAEAGHVVRRSAIAHAFLGHLARTSGDLDLAAAEHTLAQASFRALGNRLGDAWASHDLALVALGAGRRRRRGRTARCGTAGLRGRAGRLGGGLGRQRPGRGGAAPARVGPGRGAPRGRAGRLRRQRRPARVRRTASALLGELATARGLDGQAERLEAGLRHPASLPALARSVAEAAAAPESPLTPRQREVATLVAQGATNRQIARARWASPTRPSRCTSRRSCTGSGCRTGPRWPRTPPSSGPRRLAALGDFPELSAATRRPVDLSQGRTARRRNQVRGTP